MKYWKLFWQFRKIHLMRTLEFRGNFYFWTLVSTMWTVFNFFFFALIVRVGGSIGGWDTYQMYVLLSTFTMIDAFTWSFFYSNMNLYSEAVFSGDLNQFLLKPVDTQFLLMTQHNTYDQIFRFILGLGMLIWTLGQIGTPVSWWQVVIFTFIFIVVLSFLYFLWFTLSTGAFWVEKLININQILPSMRRVWQVPHTVYRGLASTIFTVILPLGLLSSIPSEFLLGQGSFGWLVYLIVFAIFIFLLSRWFFRFSIKKYSGVGN